VGHAMEKKTGPVMGPILGKRWLPPQRNRASRSLAAEAASDCG
jgi:hypothetical protein